MKMDYAGLLRPLSPQPAALPLGPGPRIRLHGGVPPAGRLHPQLQEGQPAPGEQRDRGGGRARRPLLPPNPALAAAGPRQNLIFVKYSHFC